MAGEAAGATTEREYLQTLRDALFGGGNQSSFTEILFGKRPTEPTPVFGEGGLFGTIFGGQQ